MKPSKAKGAKTPSNRSPPPQLPDEVKEEEDNPQQLPHHQTTQRRHRGKSHGEPIRSGSQKWQGNTQGRKGGSINKETTTPEEKKERGFKPKEKEQIGNLDLPIKLEKEKVEQEEGRKVASPPKMILEEAQRKQNPQAGQGDGLDESKMEEGNKCSEENV